MLLIFSHKLTELQINDARETLGVEEFQYLPEDLQHIWSNISPDREDINPLLEGIIKWLDIAHTDDYILVQGDFGATYKIVKYCKSKGLKAVYSTTKREAIEKTDVDGKIYLTHKVSHLRFREY